MRNKLFDATPLRIYNALLRSCWHQCCVDLHGKIQSNFKTTHYSCFLTGLMFDLFLTTFYVPSTMRYSSSLEKHGMWITDSQRQIFFCCCTYSNEKAVIAIPLHCPVTSPLWSSSFCRRRLMLDIQIVLCVFIILVVSLASPQTDRHIWQLEY